MRNIIIKPIAILFVLSLAFPPNHTITIAWKDPQNLTSMAGFSGNDGGVEHHPILVGNDQTLFLFWFQDMTASDQSYPIEYCDIFFSKSLDSGETWASPERLTWRGFRPGGMSVAISNNNIHMVYFEYMGKQLHYMNSIDAGTTWTKKTIFTTSIWFGRISLAAYEDKIHIAWSLSGSPIFYSNSFDNGLTWNETKRITALGKSYWDPRILVYRENVCLFYVSFTRDLTDSVTDEIYYVKSQNNGESFGPQIKHPLGEYLHMAAANNNYIHLYAGDTYLRSADFGDSWDEQTILDIAAIAVDNDNVLLLIRAGTNDLYYLFSVDNGASWIDTYPKHFLNLSTGDIYWDQISAMIREKQIHIVWELHVMEDNKFKLDSIDTYYIKGNFKIWNKKGMPRKR